YTPATRRAARDATTDPPANVRMAVPKPSASAEAPCWEPEVFPPSPPPLMPARAGTAATPINWAPRAKVLLTPEARPACRSGADANTVAVNGATVVDSPSATTTTPGSTPVTQGASGSNRDTSTRPTARSNGPTHNRGRGPIPQARSPERADD